ncbi:MAG: Gfo/Idh/MocA family oxidoreductase [Pirellulales bacterium]|nr:Gfo/Idh/MocA family oxidoreductase [Pirellulales bacterium]
MFEPVRIGVIGAGRYGRQHAQTVASIVESRLVAWVDHDPAVMENIRLLLPEVPRWQSVSKAISQSDAEAWIVASSTSSHVEIASTLLSAGAKVLLEKPLAQRLADTEPLGRHVTDDSGNLMMGHIMLFNDDFRRLLSEVDGRGPIRYINSVRHRGSQKAKWYPGEIPLHLLMTHDLCMTLVLVGGAEPVAFHARNSCGSDGTCDLSLAELVWDNGAVASLSASYLTPSSMEPGGFDRLEVFGEGWFGRLAPNPRPTFVCDDRVWWLMPFEFNTDPAGPNNMMAEQLRCFCRVVRGLQTVPVGARYEDAVTILRWQTKLFESALVS